LKTYVATGLAHNAEYQNNLGFYLKCFESRLQRIWLESEIRKGKKRKEEIKIEMDPGNPSAQ
jgi:hypothetical protein